jgi:predicted RNase H-like HicB family nuclease
MRKINFVYVQEDDKWVGWLEEFPDYRTQGETLDELKQNLKDIYEDLTPGKITNVHKRVEHHWRQSWLNMESAHHV